MRQDAGSHVGLQNGLTAGLWSQSPSMVALYLTDLPIAAKYTSVDVKKLWAFVQNGNPRSTTCEYNKRVQGQIEGRMGREKSQR